jgi:hypothetical protein
MRRLKLEDNPGDEIRLADKTFNLPSKARTRLVKSFCRCCPCKENTTAEKAAENRATLALAPISKTKKITFS